MLAVKNLTGTSTIINRDVRLMGNNFGFSVVTDDHNWALARIDSAVAEILRVEKLLSTFTEDSSINAINRNAGIQPVKVGSEIFKLIDRALQISLLTDGAFDITYNAVKETSLTTPTKKLKKKIILANYCNVVIDHQAQTVYLKNKGMRIGFGAISRGYAADRAKFILQMDGVSSGVINAGGDLLTWGLQPDNTPWTIAAADQTQANKPYADVNISNMAVANSYNNDTYNNLVNADINPETGFPISKTERVSIFAPTAELAGAMTTPIITMGVNAGLYLINKLNQIACIMVDDHARVYPSKVINIM